MAEERTFKLWNNKEKRPFEIVAVKNGKEWVGTCPNHEDKDPSLSINAEKGIYHCHSINCNFSGQLYNPEYARKGKRKVVAIFDYKDEDGKLLYQKLKYDDGTYSQRRPGKNNTWIDDLKSVQMVLYRLPELIASKDEIIYFVEGEKDVETIYKLGLTGTTTAEHRSKLEKSYNKYLANKIITICPDNDESGEWYMSIIGNALYDTAKEIKILRLPGLKNKEDITDWIEKGHTKKELLKLTADAPLYEKQKVEKPVKPKSIKIITKTLVPDLVHLVKDEDGAVKYLLKENGKLIIKDSVVINNTLCKPKQDLPIFIPSHSIINESLKVDYKKLFNDVESFLKSYLEMPNETNYMILALWVFHTYLIEKFNCTPILYFYGNMECGKTRAGEVLQYLAYRGEMITSPTEASEFRATSFFQHCVIIDEVKLWGAEANLQISNLFKSRYKRGIKIKRTNQTIQGEDSIEYFTVFGCTCFCTTENIPGILKSRCITFYMQKNLDPDVEKEIDEELAEQLRNKLTLFRANHIDKKLVEIKTVARRRLGEILNPLYKTLMIIYPEKESEFKNIVDGMQKEKEDESLFTIEAEIIEEIAKQGDKFLTTDITNSLNKDKPEKEKFSNKLISNRISRLGYKKIRFSGGKRGFENNFNLTAKLENEYKTNKKSDG